MITLPILTTKDMESSMLESAVYSYAELLRTHKREEILLASGISEPAIETVLQTTNWIPSERRTCKLTLDALVWGTLDTIGLPRYEVSAEWVAVIIASWVRPLNYSIACHWFDQRTPMTALLQHSDDQPDLMVMPSITASQLHAMVIVACARLRAVRSHTDTPVPTLGEIINAQKQASNPKKINT